MIRLGAAMWVGVIAISAGAAFGISFEVQALRDRLASVNRDIASEEDTIRVLKAEWAYMTQPTRLREMAQEYTELAPIVPGQMLEDAAALPMPLRSPDAPPVNGTGVPAEALVAMMEVPGFGMAPLPARPGEPRTGGIATAGHAPEAPPPATGSGAGGGYDAPPPVVATTRETVVEDTGVEEPPVVRRPASPPPAAAPAPRVVPAAPDDDPIAALLVSFEKEP